MQIDLKWQCYGDVDLFRVTLFLNVVAYILERLGMACHLLLMECYVMQSNVGMSQI